MCVQSTCLNLSLSGSKRLRVEATGRKEKSVIGTWACHAVELYDTCTLASVRVCLGGKDQLLMQMQSRLMDREHGEMMGERTKKGLRSTA